MEPGRECERRDMIKLFIFSSPGAVAVLVGRRSGGLDSCIT